METRGLSGFRERFWVVSCWGVHVGFSGVANRANELFRAMSAGLSLLVSDILSESVGSLQLCWGWEGMELGSDEVGGRVLVGMFFGSFLPFS